MPLLKKSDRLKKELGLFDVYAIATGAMFSSGFFLLPGLAAGKSGPAVVLAYLLAGILILPAMVSVAELSTAMPRAGGAYYFLDRSLGPLVGTVGGLGTYIALTLKSAFALLGMGAYLSLFVELPIKPVAVALTIGFLAVNLVGAKETTTLQRFLVVFLVIVLSFFIVQGLVEVIDLGLGNVLQTQFQPFAPFGAGGILATAGFVFVSYAGLTKVASVAEEVHDPDRNVPLGMALSLLTATVVYVVGVFIMVAVLDSDQMRHDLTPVATASQEFFDWLPQPFGLIVIVAAAIAAFASTGNAGLMSASRYPLAMARDRLLPDSFAELGRFHTPTRSIVATAFLMIVIIVGLDIEGVAKLASAFQLLIFMFLNLAVVVMRESRIMSYVPGYASPFYPWTQIIGIVTPVFLIASMGWVAILFTLAVIALCLAWYFYYAQSRVTRDGAIYHWFEHLGQRRYEGLDPELRSILKEKGLRETDPFEYVVARSPVVDLDEEVPYGDIVDRVAPMLARELPLTADAIRREFIAGSGRGATPVARGIALPHILIDNLDDPCLVLVRVKQGVTFPLRSDRQGEQSGSEDAPDEMLPEEVDDHARAADDVETPQGGDGSTGHEPPSDTRLAYALFFLASPESDPGLHLRILAQIAGRADEENFLSDWLEADSANEVKAVLLRDKRFLSLRLERGGPGEPFIGEQVASIDLPSSCLIAVVRRKSELIVPHGATLLQEGDVLTIIGSPESIRELRERLTPASRT